MLALSISLLSKPVPVEQKLVSIHVAQTLGDFPAIKNESIEVQAALADLASSELMVSRIQAAFLRYPNMASEILPMYGFDPQFQTIFKEYGDLALPAIQYFVSNPVGTVEWMNKAGKQYEEIKAWFSNTQLSTQQAASAVTKLTPQERGFRAINYIDKEGHNFMGQFKVAEDEKVTWLYSERVLEGISQFFGSGVTQLETRYQQDLEIRASDIGWASLDVLVFASSVKVLRAGRTVALGSQTAARTTRSATLAARTLSGGRLVLSGARYAKWPVLIGGTYVVLAHPSIINDALAEMGGVLGLPGFFVQFVGWSLILMPILLLLHSLLWVLRPFVKTVMWSVGRMFMVIGKPAV